MTKEVSIMHVNVKDPICSGYKTTWYYDAVKNTTHDSFLDIVLCCLDFNERKFDNMCRQVC